jgi:outer membrane lipoprotein SlyB
MNHHRPRATALPFIAALLASLAACTTPQTASNYGRAETRMLQQVQLGELLEVREVTLDAQPTGQGGTAGVVLGGVSGAQRGNATQAAIGGVLGSFLGQGIEDAAGRRKGLELLVKLDDGNLVSVTQEADGLKYEPGQRVRVLLLNGTARVVHHPAQAPRTPPAATSG